MEEKTPLSPNIYRLHQNQCAVDDDDDDDVDDDDDDDDDDDEENDIT